MYGVEYKVSLPRPCGEIVEKYKTIFNVDEEYTAYSINDKLEVVKGKGVIQNNDRYNYHKNEDISEDELYFKFTSTTITNRWWTPSKKEAIEKQKELIDENIKHHEEIIVALEKLKIDERF